MKFSLSLKKSKSDDKSGKVDFKSSEDVTSQFGESDGADSKNDGELKPFQIKIDFKGAEEPVDDPVLTKYDEFITEDRKSGFEPTYLGHDKKSEEVEPETRPESKYIEKLVKAAQKRQIERELVIGNKERGEAEGEVFVTTAYRKKLEEREKIIQKIKEQDLLDDIEAKNKNFTSLYKNMLDSNMLKRRRS